MKQKIATICTALVLSANMSNSQTLKNIKMEPFKIKISDNVITDLKQRLSKTIWPGERQDAGWNFGTSEVYLKELVDYWQTKYDWKKQETLLNQHPQFVAEIDGIKIHFIYVKGKGKNSQPLLLTHGWPDNFYRFHKVIPMLTDPAKYGGNAEESFDVIVPSIPGFGFSQKTAVPATQVADIFAKLMTDVLGYKKFFAAGGDVGANVTKALASKHADKVEAVHLTDVGYDFINNDPSTMTEDEKKFAQFVQQWWFSEGAYAMVQMTKPQSLAYGLADSPVGLAAWILNFGSAGAQPEIIEKAFGGKDELLTNIMIYWVTQTIASSVRMYKLDAMAAYSGTPLAKSNVPAGISLFPREAQFPKEYAERSVNVAYYKKMNEGGHFAALEVPQLFSSELRKFFFEVKK